jgi:uncharacterized lipoprotein YmbA
MNTDKPRWSLLVRGSQFLAFSLLLSACSSVLPQPQADTTRHFTLAGLIKTAAVTDGTRVQPVQVTGHLRSRSMAVRVSENEVVYLDDVVWAESLADGITQTLRNRLSVVASDADVSVQIQRCELDRSAGNAVQLVATYSITLAGPAGPVTRRGLFTSAARTWDGKDHGMLVTLLRDAVDELADRLVSQLAEKTS